MKKIKDAGYCLALILFLTLFRLLLNRFTRTISFSTDEFIPVAIAAHHAGLDWLNARKFNYYYGYMTLLFFLPLFKVPFIYQNSFLLTQFMAGINTFFYIVMAVFLYAAVNLLYDSRNRKQAFWITLVSVCNLQVFIVGSGAQIESLFCLSYMIVFYCLVRMAKGRESGWLPVIMALFTGIAVINNSRGAVLFVAVCIILLMRLLYAIGNCGGRKHCRENVRDVILYVLTMAVIMCLHRYVVKPYYMQFFMVGAANTDSGSFLSKLKLMLGDREYFGAFVRVVLGWLWAFNVSTFGFFFIAVAAICRQIVNALKQKDMNKLFIPAFILLNMIGILLLCGIMCVVSAHSLFVLSESSRADLIIYTRYFASITSVTVAYGLYAFMTDKLLKSRKGWLLLGTALYLSCKLFQTFVATGMDGFQYGVNNTVFLSLILGNFQDTYRYGVVHAGRFFGAHFLMLLLFGMMRLFIKKKEIFLRLLAFFSIGVCVLYCSTVAEKRSDYYTSVFEAEIIEYCRNSDREHIYVNDSMAPVAQYLMPDKKLYFQLDGQDILIVTPEKAKDVDQTEYREVMRTPTWFVYERL